MEKFKELISDMDDSDWLGFAGIVFIFVLVIAMAMSSTSVDVTGEVIDKMYSPSTLSTGVGYGTGQNATPVIVTTGRGERWTLVMKTAEGIQSYQVSVEVYYSVEIGQTFTMECGKTFGIIGCERARMK